MSKWHATAARSTGQGMSLVELLVALALNALLLLGLVQFATAAGASRQLQDNQALLQDQARAAFRLLGDSIAEAGFAPRPWDPAYRLDDAFAGSADAVTAVSDRLVVRAWSDRNCFDNLNPVTDAAGRPAFHLRESAYELDGRDHVTRACRYGPSATELTTQVRRQGRVPGVETFQLLFGEDADGDGNVERWVRAGGWSEPRRVLGVRVGLVLRSAEAVVEPAGQSFEVLDRRIETPADGRLRTALEFTVAVRGRSG